MFARKKERALEKRLRTGRINKAEKLAKGVTQRPRGEVSEEASLDLPARPAGWKDDTLEGLVRGLVPEQTVLLVVRGQKGDRRTGKLGCVCGVDGQTCQRNHLLLSLHHQAAKTRNVQGSTPGVKF